MKKSLIALAALAAVGAVSAESSVTLYGIVDTYLQAKSTDTGKTNGSLTQSFLNSGGVNGSRWGMKGTEDLGGGLKANFQLESGFAADTGASTSGTLLFSRQSWVGLSGNFGAVKAGRAQTPYEDLRAGAVRFDLSILAPASMVFKSWQHTKFTDNTIKYESSVYSGFSGAVSYGLGEDKTVTTDATNKTAFNLAYTLGALNTSFAYQVETLAPAAGRGDKKFSQFNVSYDLGAWVAKANAGQARNIGNITNADATDYQFGFDYKASSALTLSGSFAHSVDNSTQSVIDAIGMAGTGTGDVKRSGIGLGATYTLSKRTFLYGGYVNSAQTRSGASDVKDSSLAAGVQHRF